MTDIYSLPSATLEFYNHLNNGFKTIGDWTGYTIEWLRNIPNQMKNQTRVAFAVFAIANLLFFIQINAFANFLEERVHSGPQKLDRKNRVFNNILIDVCVVGSASVIFNFLLSKLTDYPLSKTTLAAIALTTVIARTFFHFMSEEDEELVVDDNTEDIIEDVEEPLNQEENRTEEPEDSKLIEESEEVESEEIKESQHENFINNFCNEIDDVLNSSFKYVNFNVEQKMAQDLFLKQMKQCLASIEDHGDICRAANVPIQAAFEEVLSKKLANGDITQATVLFLTGLPCTPLRTPRQTIDASKEAEWKKWTVDIRTQTVRNLRAAGASILVSYYATDYQTLPEQSAKGKIEFDNYEVEKTQPHTVDLPLSFAIPKELIGALYLFKDKEGNEYILATQGIQIQHHGEAPKECWKMWLGHESHAEVKARAQEMMALVLKDKPEVKFNE